MSSPAIVFLALGLSVDAMIAALGRGAALARPRWAIALRIGLLFGVIEAGLAVAGWALGRNLGAAFAAFDHWIAFALLGLVGGRMLLGGGEERRERVGLAALVFAAFGSSVDAMAVGASLALLSVPIAPVALAIGAATFGMAAGAVMAAGVIGRRLGPSFAPRAEGAGGVALIGLGTWILTRGLIA
ncbi:manganese efflux pump MntP family protein [Pikeienuella sp. HZG-20]|uniref:manganese efflux pump MntP n=1 Tax=Paludibacillus litoralis TaxID=3133267 RepID=UPI0030EF83B7